VAAVVALPGDDALRLDLVGTIDLLLDLPAQAGA